MIIGLSSSSNAYERRYDPKLKYDSGSLKAPGYDLVLSLLPKRRVTVIRSSCINANERRYDPNTVG